MQTPRQHTFNNKNIQPTMHLRYLLFVIAFVAIDASKKRFDG
jgi:hypothetical protein